LGLVESSGRRRKFLAGGGGERGLDDSIRIDLGSSKVGFKGLDLVTSLQNANSHHREEVVSGVRVVVWGKKGGEEGVSDGPTKAES